MLRFAQILEPYSNSRPGPKHMLFDDADITLCGRSVKPHYVVTVSEEDSTTCKLCIAGGSPLTIALDRGTKIGRPRRIGPPKPRAKKLPWWLREGEMWGSQSSQ